MYPDITGIILAGGQSKRMGLNKSFLKLGDKTIIVRTAELLKSVFEKVILITNTPQEYKFLQLPLFEDIYKDQGPLGGIHSGLMHSKTEKNFVISCDMPLITKEIIEFIINYKTEKIITVAEADGFVQQLCGVYPKKVLPEIIKILDEDFQEESGNGNKKRGCKVLRLVKELNAEIINIESEFDGYQEGMFYNMNKPDEYEYIKDRLEINFKNH